MEATAAVEAHRGWLIGLAYRLLGSAAEAEDAVQETFVRYAQASDVSNPRAWLRTVCTRICLDQLRSARSRRETYVGPWLPEPLLVDDSDPAAAAAQAETLSFAFLVLLETLSPEERVAFLLHDVFGAPFAEVATALDRSEAAARQLASRARRHIAERRPRFEPDARARAEVAEAFLAACETGDIEAFLRLCAPDVVLVSDGGGVVPAAMFPLVGQERVIQLLQGLARMVGADLGMRRLMLNGTPGAIFEPPGVDPTVVVLDIADGQVVGISMIRAPEKVEALRRQLADG